MAVKKSDQMTNETADPITTKNDSSVTGKPIREYFSFTTPAGKAVVDDTIQLTKIPAGARILGGHAAWEGMSSGAGDSSMKIGDGTTADKYLGTTSVDAAGSAAFGNTVALGFGDKLSAAMTLTATVVTEDWAAAKKLLGYVDYLL